MGMIGSLFAVLFCSGRNVLKETAEVFRPNVENDAQRDNTANAAIMAQAAAEFGHKGWFNQLVDGLNRLPRLMMAFGVIGLLSVQCLIPSGLQRGCRAWFLCLMRFGHFW